MAAGRRPQTLLQDTSQPGFAPGFSERLTNYPCLHRKTAERLSTRTSPGKGEKIYPPPPKIYGFSSQRTSCRGGSKESTSCGASKIEISPSGTGSTLARSFFIPGRSRLASWKGHGSSQVGACRSATCLPTSPPEARPLLAAPPAGLPLSVVFTPPCTDPVHRPAVCRDPAKFSYTDPDPRKMTST